jgi:rhamnosyltransferase subunit B
MLETAPHYIVITGGTTGDIHPFMRIASALQGLGRKVTFITNTYHARLVQSAGLAFVGLGTDEDYLRVVANPDLWDPKKGFSVLMANYSDLLEQINEAIRSVCADAPMVAIAHPFAVPGAVIARERGFIDSVVAAYLAPSNLRSCCDPLTMGPTRVPSWVPMRWRRALWRFVEKGWIDPVALAHLNAVRTPRGLPKVDSFLTHMAEAPDLSVTLFPSWFASTAPDWPQPLISGDFQLFEVAPQEDLPQALCTFLAAGDKPMVFTAGTGNLHAADFFACALSAVHRLGCRAVFLSRDRAQAPAHLPPSVLWQPYVPLCELLPHAAALVHHGGIGTAAEALCAGTPQLIAPFAWDQFDNGARIASLGAGVVIPAKRLRPAKLAQSLQALCSSDAIRAACLRLAARLMPAHEPTRLCREVDSFVRARLDAAKLIKLLDN